MQMIQESLSKWLIVDTKGFYPISLSFEDTGPGAGSIKIACGTIRMTGDFSGMESPSVSHFMQHHPAKDLMALLSYNPKDFDACKKIVIIVQEAIQSIEIPGLVSFGVQVLMDTEYEKPIEVEIRGNEDSSMDCLVSSGDVLWHINHPAKDSDNAPLAAVKTLFSSNTVDELLEMSEFSANRQDWHTYAGFARAEIEAQQRNGLISPQKGLEMYAELQDVHVSACGEILSELFGERWENDVPIFTNPLRGEARLMLSAAQGYFAKR